MAMDITGYTVLDPVTGRRVSLSELTSGTGTTVDTSGTDRLLAALYADEPKGDWMETHTGRKVYPLSPDPRVITAEDIAHSLSMTCRYNGHVRDFYSTAEHCCHIADWLLAIDASRQTALAGLLHDGGEAYVGDTILPIKRSLGDMWEKIEDGWDAAVAEWAGLLPPPWTRLVKEADRRIVRDERLALMPNGRRNVWKSDSLQPLGVTIHCWSPATARREWLRRFTELRAPR